MNQKQDCLNRTLDKNQIVNLIKSATKRKERLSFAINGKWGSGKSFFINLLEEDLKSDFFVFKYDSWANDYYDEPMIGMLDSIKDQLNKINDLEKTFGLASQKTIKLVISAIGEFIDKVVSSKTGISPFKSFKKIKEFWDDCSKDSKISDDFNPYNKIKASKLLIIASMNELSKFKPVIFIVDEIDRCFPTYTLKIIERIHHISENVINCTAIFSVDTEQLQKIINLVYSKEQEKDKSKKETDEKDIVKGYLRKVIDFTYDLGNGNLDKQFYKEQEYDDLRKRFDQPIIGVSEDDIQTFVDELFKNVEMRVVLKLINNCKYAHELVFGDKKHSAELMCAELMLAWATNEYGGEMLTKMSKDIFETSVEKRHFIEFISKADPNYTLLIPDIPNNRNYINITNLKSLMIYFVTNHKRHLTNFPDKINAVPRYREILLNEYLSTILKIKC